MQISKLIMIKKINNTTAERRVSYPRQQLSLHRINLGWRCKLYAPHCLTASRYVAVHVSVSCSSNVWAPWKKGEESWIEKMWDAFADTMSVSGTSSCFAHKENVYLRMNISHLSIYSSYLGGVCLVPQLLFYYSSLPSVFLLAWRTTFAV